MKTLISIIFFVLITTGVPITAQEISSSITLSDSAMITAFGESDYFIWLGTNEGLYKFNKRNGKYYHYIHQGSKLPDDYITSIACTADGQTYIGTIKGLLFWDNSSFHVINEENSSLPDNCVTSLAFDPDDNLWIGTYHEGLVKYTGTSNKSFNRQPIEFNNESIYSVAFDQSGHLWVAFYRSSQIASLQNGEWKLYARIDEINSVAAGKAGKFMLNTSQGVYLRDGNIFKPLSLGSSNLKKTGGYFNAVYSRFILFYKDGVYVMNWDDPFTFSTRTSIQRFSISLAPECSIQKSNSGILPDTGSVILSPSNLPNLLVKGGN